METELTEGEIESPEKKAWSALHGAWGKRPVKQSKSGQYF